MILPVAVLLLVTTCAHGRPRGTTVRNDITVPENCPEGQRWINGACRDIWLFAEDAATKAPHTLDSVPLNIVTAPPNCPPGQHLINGACRDIFRTKEFPQSAQIKNVITVPPNCLPGQKLINGQCRDVWFSNATPSYVAPRNDGLGSQVAPQNVLFGNQMN
ncbi:unnamed protein product [Leptosia nina]|uniref:Uncharacterized protein n=1 Tax=Leptosia nina TaxID=320188 RepID=A0AAV1J7L2_9NEOP